MKLEKGMLATLSDGKDYVVMSTIKLDNIIYVYLVEHEKLDNMKFCIEDMENGKTKLTEVDNINLRQSLLKEFINQLQQKLQ